MRKVKVLLLAILFVMSFSIIEFNFSAFNNNNINSHEHSFRRSWFAGFHDGGSHLENSLLSDEHEQPVVIGVLLFACNRVTVKRTLDQLLKYRPSESTFPIVVSQDCDHEPTRQVISQYKEKIMFIQQPNQSDIVLEGSAKKLKGYYKIARHYGWALNYTLNRLNYDTVIIVEDDLDLSPDFFEYFLALYRVLKADSSIYCVSAWNDNGKGEIVENDPTKLYRSDFFPGLGWMLTRDVWNEFQHKWPHAFWDDWMREPAQRRNRVCIRPELSRTKTFGKIGVSNGLFYEKHLKFIKLNDKFTPFTQMDLTYLIKEKYDVQFEKQVNSSELIKLINDEKADLSEENNSNSNLHIEYNTKEEFKAMAKMFGLMNDFKSGVPRTAYRGVVSFMFDNFRIYLTPNSSWNGYNISWT